MGWPYSGYHVCISSFGMDSDGFTEDVIGEVMLLKEVAGCIYMRERFFYSQKIRLPPNGIQDISNAFFISLGIVSYRKTINNRL